jgi:hypothetical protein
MATTTNYGWGTPDDTDLVKDGALAIRDLGSDIDSTVFANAGAAIAKTIVDAKGDIIAATADDTVSRLAVGANDTVLTADSSTATGLKWAAPAVPTSGLNLISTGSFTTASTISLPDNTFTSTYRNYRLILEFTATNSNYLQLRLRASGSDNTTSNYSSTYAYYYYGSNGISADDRAQGATIWSRMGYTETSGNHNGTFDIYQPQEAKQTNINGLWNRSGSGGAIPIGTFGATTQFDSLSIIAAAGTFTGNYSIYGYAK